MIKEFSKAVLIEIIQDFSDKKRVFSNEAQFQFELGQSLRDKGYIVLFEVLSVDDNKKIYTDLVIHLGEGHFVALELKYKSAIKPTSGTKGYDEIKNAFYYGENEGLKQYIYPQGAEDEGSYAFLKDVERLEKMKRRDFPLNFHEDNIVDQAYAIIIANARRDSKTAYWADHETCQWKDFSLGQGRTISGSIKHWKESPEKNLLLKNSYLCDWRDYYNSEESEYPIKYMIFEIK